MQHVLAGVRVESVSQRNTDRSGKAANCCQYRPQLQFAIIAHSKEIEVAFSQIDEGRRRSKIATLWEPVCDGRLTLLAIPVFVVILGVVFAELAYDVDAVRYLVDDLRCSLEYTAHVLPNQSSKGRPSICGRGSNSFPQPIGRVDMVPR